MVFAGAAFLTTEPAKIIIDPGTVVAPPPPDLGTIKKHFPVPTPNSNGTFEKSGPGYKSLPAKEPRVAEKKPVPVPPAAAVIQEKSLTENEYFRGGVGAVIGWLVKSICEILLGLIKKLSFIKNLGW